MPRDTCFYDGLCGLCTRSKAIISALDWLHRIEWVDMTKVDPAVLPVPLDAAMRGMPMRTADDRVLIGFQAIRRALFQTPLGAIPAAILYIPGISHLGGAVYAYVAANRRRNLTCTPGSLPR